jgi:hypothetical protein
MGFLFSDVVAQRVLFSLAGRHTMYRLLHSGVFALLFVACGCINVYNRSPGGPRLEEVYESTHQAAALTLVAAFPQIMADGKQGFMWENLLTVPFFGIPCAVDTVLEACVDTVCLPVDACLVSHRRKK